MKYLLKSYSLNHIFMTISAILLVSSFIFSEYKFQLFWSGAALASYHALWNNSKQFENKQFRLAFRLCFFIALVLIVLSLNKEVFKENTSMVNFLNNVSLIKLYLMLLFVFALWKLIFKDLKQINLIKDKISYKKISEILIVIGFLIMIIFIVFDKIETSKFLGIGVASLATIYVIIRNYKLWNKKSDKT